MNDPTIRRRSAGFTLVELLLVVLLLTFVSVVASTSVHVIGASDSRRSPEVAAELSLVAQLVQLAGVAVLLFGAGFWYLVELHEAGRLDRFRVGHFLLLASTYSLFFAVFAVLGSHEVDAWLAVTIAAAVSYPLLVLHVATIVDLRFACVSALPLAVLTTGMVVNGVYGGDVRSFVYLGMVCLVVAVLTLTHPRLARGREAHVASRELALAGRVASLTEAASTARTIVATASARLELQDPIERKGLREWAEGRLAVVRRELGAHENLLTTIDGARGKRSRGERAAACAVGERLAERLLQRLPQACHALDEAVAVLETHRATHAGAAAATATHCIACGHGCGADARYCPGCGAVCPESRTCRRCDSITRLPRHLLPATDTALPPTFCFGCGERHAA